jgi:hypothetical protein
MRLKELLEVLAGNGLSITNIGSVTEQSVAGLISTGTHGSSPVHGSLSTLVLALQLVLANGTAIRVSAQENVGGGGLALVCVLCTRVHSCVLFVLFVCLHACPGCLYVCTTACMCVNVCMHECICVCWDICMFVCEAHVCGGRVARACQWGTWPHSVGVCCPPSSPGGRLACGRLSARA